MLRSPDSILISQEEERGWPDRDALSAPGGVLTLGKQCTLLSILLLWIEVQDLLSRTWELYR